MRGHEGDEGAVCEIDVTHSEINRLMVSEWNAALEAAATMVIGDERLSNRFCNQHPQYIAREIRALRREVAK